MISTTKKAKVDGHFSFVNDNSNIILPSQNLKIGRIFLQSESPIQEREDIPPPETETEDQTKSATYSRLVEDEDEFMYIRESTSAPLDSPVLKGMQCTPSLK